MNIKSNIIPFEVIDKRVREVTETEYTYLVTAPDSHICDVSNYSEYGLNSLGKLVGFPANFILDLAESNEELANIIITDRMGRYFHTARENKKQFYIREFNGKIYGALSNRYAFFDDNAVCDILANSPLSTLKYQESEITPERLHLRAIDLDNPFKVTGDNSNLFFVYYIDNSMLGLSAFKVRLGVFRQICSNGMIVPQHEFTVCKAVHRGERNIADEFNAAILSISSQRDQLINLVTFMSEQKAAIEDLNDMFRTMYVQKKLNLSQKESFEVLELYDSYSETYGIKSKWAMVSAITEFAKGIENIERRTLIESRAASIA